jgi:isocitrate dehydrogenase (NAD+)
MLKSVAQRVAVNATRNTCYGGRHTITIIPGDGIGPEMCYEVRKTIDMLGVPVNFEEVSVDG